ncbi:MAG: hypothetical protein ACQERO_09880 [Bacteroidota bacterium]
MIQNPKLKRIRRNRWLSWRDYGEFSSSTIAGLERFGEGIVSAGEING